MPSKVLRHRWCRSCSTNRNRHQKNSTRFEKPSKNTRAGDLTNEFLLNAFLGKVCRTHNDSVGTLHVAGGGSHADSAGHSEVAARENRSPPIPAFRWHAAHDGIRSHPDD